MRNINCNLCNSNDYRVIMKSADVSGVGNTIFNIVKCQKCGLVFINPQPNAEELKKHYPADYGPYNSNFELLKYGPITGFLKRLALKIKRSKKNKTEQNKSDNSTDTFLDIGCGSGAYLEKMRRHHPNWNLYGLDNSEFACKSAESKGFKVFCGDTLKLSLPENFFDHVYMGHVIEHVEDPMKTIKKVNSLLKKDGTFTLITPNIDSLDAKIFKRFWFALEAPRHLYLFSPKTLSEMLVKNGFSIESVTFNEDLRVGIIRSLHYLFGGKYQSINPVFWHFFWYALKPFSIVLSFFGKTSIMTIKAKKT